MVWHAGEFNKPVSAPELMELSERVLQDLHYEVWQKADGGYAVIGGNAGVIISIVCSPIYMPAGAYLTWIGVIACSDDSATAEAARNTVRSKIVG